MFIFTKKIKDQLTLTITINILLQQNNNKIHLYLLLDHFKTLTSTYRVDK